MPTTVKPISDQWRRHVYTDDLPACPLVPDADPANPFKGIGVTSQIKPLKHDFSDHATKVVARWAVEHRHVWAELSIEAAVTLIAGERDRALNSAANRGSDLHRAVEAHAGGATALTILDPNAAPYLPGVEKFVAECRPEFIWSEVAVFNRTENYAGASDGVGRLLAYPELGVLQFDWKSREKAQVYETEAPQLAAYARAEYGILDGQRVPLPVVDGGMVVCFTPDGYELFPVSIDQAWPVFLAAKNLYQIKSEARKAVGAALVKKSTERAEASAAQTPTTTAPTVDLFADGPGASPSVPDPSALRADLEQRAKRIMSDYPDGIPFLAAAVAARGLGKLSATPDDQLHVWLAAVKDVESDLRVPFPEDPPAPTPKPPTTVEREEPAASPAPVVGLPATHPAIQAVIERCKALPSDLFAAVEANTVGAGRCPNLISGRATQADLALVEEQVALAEGEWERRKVYAASILADFPDDDAMAILTEVVPDATNLERLGSLSDVEVECIADLVEAIERLVVAFSYDGDKPTLVTTDTAEATLVELHGSKSAALTAAKTAASAHGRPSPRSVAAAAADPLVVAAALPLTQPTTQPTERASA